MPPPDEAPDAGDAAPLRVHELEIDPTKRTVRLRGAEVVLTFVEFEVLHALARSPGRVFTRDNLLVQVWGDSSYRDPRTIDVHIAWLRQKLEDEPQNPKYIHTIRGKGYRFST